MISTYRLDYRLPPESIAQVPSERRDGSRLLVVDRSAQSVSHRMFGDLPGYLRKGDTLFRNNASVLPARLHGHRPTGGKVECFLLRKADVSGDGRETWKCLVRPGRRLQAGATFEAAGGALSGEVASHNDDGSVLIRFTAKGGESVADVANRSGDIPLPPYITRADDSLRERDRERYQTVYADGTRQVAVAAPTAGLHFTPGILADIRERGVRTADLTLHVGLGTFRPIATATVEEHPIHGEIYEIPEEAQRALFPPLAGRRVAVGTTSVRSIEDFLSRHEAPLGRPHVAEASLFIHPPRTFRGVDALITNFHQPRSTLLCLVAAFLAPGSEDGIDWLMEIYAGAVRDGYRFLSYGDAMLVV
ncbi:MAG TPA: tRNA preQ1(34) S-adenosylmethionine ribosyltransferase-isomerase QueA [Opitutaceae bacterium]